MRTPVFWSKQENIDTSMHYENVISLYGSIENIYSIYWKQQLI